MKQQFRCVRLISRGLIVCFSLLLRLYIRVQSKPIGCTSQIYYLQARGKHNVFTNWSFVL